jgi:hypothetical protein
VQSLCLESESGAESWIGAHEWTLPDGRRCTDVARILASLVASSPSTKAVSSSPNPRAARAASHAAYVFLPQSVSSGVWCAGCQSR